MSNPSIHDSASPVKLTFVQRSVLIHLQDGDEVYRHWSRLIGPWTVRGTWGTVSIRQSTIDALIKAKLVEKTSRQVDWICLRLTPAGEAAAMAVSHE